MRPLKCYVLALRCAWEGHDPVPGSVYSWVLGRRIPCVCCSRCHKVMPSESVAQ